ncbi:zonular occludens toxin domain-containing protein [Nitrincola sp.]|uniref:zonular occludens toxin domain-containing protein n=1 Tax=Nitrincola sp. TaxID=1926584 RepID=UPI003A933F7F
MLFMLSGRPGGGKSYEAVAFHVIPALKEGRKVITNLPLKLDHFRAVYGQQFVDLIDLRKPCPSNPRPFSTLLDYQDTWTHPETGVGPLYVIDECHFCLRKGNTRRDVEEWFSMHRHYKADALLITQSYRKVDSNICDMIDIVYAVGKATAFGSQESYVRHTRSGVRGTTLDTQVRSYDSAFYPFYQSHTGSSTAGKEATVKDVKPIWKKWQFVGAALFLGAGVISMFFTVPKMFKQPDLVTSVSQRQYEPDTPDSPDTFSSLSAQFNSLDAIPQESTEITSVAAQPDRTPKHPFSEFQLRVSGHVDTSAGRILVFRALQNGQSAFMLTDKDLFEAGYELDQRGDCLVHVQYDRYTDFITCGAATQSIQAAM